jgi:uncharacterized protein YgiB involved in biofilm formation
LKRSEYIALGAIGVLLAAAFWPRGEVAPQPNDPALDTVSQGSGFTTLAFASADECRQSQAVTEADCSTAFGRALANSAADAPKYDALADCEAEYGASQCRPATWNGASVFIPALAGVLVARGLAGQMAQSQALYPPRTGPQSCPAGVQTPDRPECQTRAASGGGSSSSSSSGRSYYSTGSGRTIGRVAGAVIADMVLPSRTTVSRTATLPRGGSWANVPQMRPSTTSSSWSRSSSSSSWSSSSSSTSSRGGFGSSASSSRSSFGS